MVVHRWTSVERAHRNALMTQLLSPAEVAARLAVRRSKLFLLAKRADFPRPVRLGARTVRFVEDEVDAWIAARAVEDREG